MSTPQSLEGGDCETLYLHPSRLEKFSDIVSLVLEKCCGGVKKLVKYLLELNEERY